MQAFENVCYSALRFVFTPHSFHLTFGEHRRLVMFLQLLVRQKVLSDDSVDGPKVLQNCRAWVLGKVGGLDCLSRFKRVIGFSTSRRVKIFLGAEKKDFLC